MKLKFLGVSSALTIGKDNFSSNMLLTSDSEKHMLIDCGSDFSTSWRHHNLDINKIDSVYVSHTHFDHIGGLSYLAYYNYFVLGKKTNLYCHESLIPLIWNCLSSDMGILKDKIATIDTYFNVNVIDKHIYWENLKIYTIKNLHIDNPTNKMYSYGIYFHRVKSKTIIETPYTSVNGATYISTDTRFNRTSELISCDLAFHDCETTEKRSEVHSHYDDLNNLLPSYIKRRMWLYHYQNKKETAEKDGFLGFVNCGQEFIL